MVEAELGKEVHKRDFLVFIIAVAACLLLSWWMFNVLHVPESHPSAVAYSEMMLKKYNIVTSVNAPETIRSQSVAMTIFFATIIGTLMFWRFRLAIALIGVFLLLVTRTVGLHTLLEFMGLDVIVFLMGMFILVEHMRRTGFFRFLMVKTIKATNFRVVPLFAVVLSLATLLAALVDEVTSILFVAAIVLEICAILRINPVPLLILSVMTTNLGSAATVLGNPIGIYVAVRAGLSFEEFIRWSAPIVGLSLAATIPLGLMWYRKDVAKAKQNIAETLSTNSLMLDEWGEVKDRKKFNQAIILFIATIAIIASHRRLEELLVLDINSLLIGAPWLTAGILLLLERRQARDYVERGVDWWTLAFFLFLFAKAACLEYTGVTYKLAYAIEGTTGGSEMTVMTTISVFTLMLWLTGILSGFIDNLPVIAALLPVARVLSETGLPHGYSLWWALVIGGCFGGNLTMVGSTANIVALGLLEKQRGIYMSLRWWIFIGATVTFTTMGLANILLLLQLPLMPP